jgi:hypothetical protein
MPTLVRAVRTARRRLFAQSLLNHLVVGWSLALVVALAWFLLEPLFFSTPQPRLRLWVLVGTGNATTAAAIVLSSRRAPSRLGAALELDDRFDLKERTTTALGLTPDQQPTPAGKAVVADAEEHTRELRVRDRFPVRLKRRALWLPILGGLLALVAFVYHPVADSGLLAHKKSDDVKDDARSTADAARRARAEAQRKPKPATPDRANRAKDVQELQEELARLEANARPTDPADAAEKVAAITTAEEKAKALAKEKADRLTRLENKLGQVGKLSGDEAFKDGPAKDLTQALADGDLDRAAAAAEDIARQLRDPNLDPMKKEQLQKQLDKLGDELRKASTNQDKVDELNKRIADAKAKGADTSGLDEELARTKADADKLKDLGKLADKVESASKSLDAGKPEDAAKQLDGVAKQLDGVKGEVQDLKDLQAAEKRLGDLKGEAAGQAGGMQQSGMQPGGMGMQPGGGMGATGEPGKGDNATGGGTASGARPDNPNAKTASTDERQRTPFDGKGQKTYAGAVSGGGYTRKSPTELGPAIDRAVQEAPDAVSTQPLTRDDKDAVKEFYRDFPKK